MIECSAPREFGLLRVFLATYGDGFRLEVCDDPHARPDARGINAHAGRKVSCARLCENRVIAITPDYTYPAVLIRAIAHEMGHQEAEDTHGDFHNEHIVGVRCEAILANLAAALLSSGPLSGYSLKGSPGC